MIAGICIVDLLFLLMFTTWSFFFHHDLHTNASARSGPNKNVTETSIDHSIVFVIVYI